jgi:hypothetical protein
VAGAGKSRGSDATRGAEGGRLSIAAGEKPAQRSADGELADNFERWRYGGTASTDALGIVTIMTIVLLILA